MRDPVGRRCRKVSFRVIRCEDIDTIWDHSQNRFLRFSVHAILRHDNRFSRRWKIELDHDAVWIFQEDSRTKE